VGGDGQGGWEGADGPRRGGPLRRLARAGGGAAVVRAAAAGVLPQCGPEPPVPPCAWLARLRVCDGRAALGGGAWEVGWQAREACGTVSRRWEGRSLPAGGWGERRSSEAGGLGAGGDRTRRG